jgi:hypothetical protein
MPDPTFRVIPSPLYRRRGLSIVAALVFVTSLPAIEGERR